MGLPSPGVMSVSVTTSSPTCNRFTFKSPISRLRIRASRTLNRPMTRRQIATAPTANAPKANAPNAAAPTAPLFARNRSISPPLLSDSCNSFHCLSLILASLTVTPIHATPTLFDREAVEILSKLKRARISFPDLRFRLAFFTQRTQHAMRKNQFFHVGVGGNLPDHGRRHVQPPFHSRDTFRHCVVRNEQIGIRRQLHQACAITISVSAKNEHFASRFNSPGQSRNTSVNHAHRRRSQITIVKYRHGN